ADRFEQRRQLECIDDQHEHAHLMPRRLFDAVLSERRAADDIAAANDYGHLNAEIAHLADLLGEVLRVLRGDTEFAVSEERFARELQHHPAVLGLRLNGHQGQSRWVRRWTGPARTA